MSDSEYFDDEAKSPVGIGRALMDHQPPSVTERLLNEKKELKLRLAAIESVLLRLEDNPETMKIIDSLSRLGRL